MGHSTPKDIAASKTEGARTFTNGCVCRYELVQPPDNDWGELRPDGRWTGMIGQLQREVRATIVRFCSDASGVGLCIHATGPVRFYPLG